MTLRTKSIIVFSVVLILLLMQGMIDWECASLSIANLHSFHVVLLATLVCVCAAILTTGFIFTKSFVLPLEKLAKTTKEVAGANREQRLPVDRADELGGLAASVNRLLESAQAAQNTCDEQEKLLQARNAEVAREKAIGQAVTAELRSGKVFWTALLTALGEGVVLTDPEGHVMRMNPVAEKITGWPAEEAKRHPLNEILPTIDPERREPLPISRTEPLADGGGGAEPRRAILVSRNGPELLIEARCVLIRDANGMVLGTVLVLRDLEAEQSARSAAARLVQDAKKLGELASQNAGELAEIRRRYETLLANLPGMAYRCHPGRTWTMEFVSQGCRPLLGMEPEILTDGRVAFADLIHPEDQERVLRHLQLSVLELRGFNLEYRIKHADGRWRSVHDQGCVISGPAGELLAVEGCLTDVTQRVQAETGRRALEEQLRRAQKMEAIGTLAGGVAHDFNNVLAAILGSAELIKMDIPADHISREFVDQIFVAGRRAREVVQQLLTISHKREGERSVVHLQPVVKECVKLLRASIPAMIDINCQASPNCAQVMADPVQIHQVVLNLCTRAWQAVPAEGGLIRVKLDSCQVDAALAAKNPQLKIGSAVVLSVWDNGPALDPQALSRIFEPVFTADPANPGSGFGMSVVNDIVKHHEGVIVVESEAGKGTVFSLYFPAQAVQSDKIFADIGSLMAGNNERILLVDDDDMAGRVTEKTLKRTGYQVHWFKQPEEALAQFRAQPDGFDIVVTDLAMPIMSGEKLAALLLELRPEIPILLTTGLIDPDMEKRVMTMGVKQVLLKPIPCEVLAGEIARHRPKRRRV